LNERADENSPGREKQFILNNQRSSNRNCSRIILAKVSFIIIAKAEVFQ